MNTTQHNTTLSVVLCIMFFVAFGCVKQDLNNYDNEKGLNANTRAWVESANTPNLKRASLAANDKVILDRHLSKYTAFTIDERELAGFFRGGSGSIRLQIDEELDWTIRLELHDLRDPDYRAFYITAEGEFEITEPFIVNTFKGETSTGQHVRFTIDENTLFGVIFGENYHYVIRSANDYTQNRGDKSFIVYKSWDVIPDENFPDYIHDALEVPNDNNEQLIAQGITRSATRSSTNSLKIATDADYEFYSKYGASTNSKIMSIINLADAVYTSTFGLRLYVTFQNYYTSTASPYAYTSSTASLLLDSFKNYWNVSRTDPTGTKPGVTHINRNIAHLFTGKTLTQPSTPGFILGISFMGHINGNTANNSAYSVTMDYANMEYSTTHEIGHNLNASDNPSDGNCSSPTARSVMCQGDNIPSLVFSTQSQNQINGFLNTAINAGQLAYINGNGTVYYTSGNSYSLNNAPPGTITWSYKGPYTISPTTGSTTSVTKTATTGSGELTATVNGSVVNKVVATIQLTSAMPLIDGPSTVYAGQTYVTFRVPDAPGATYNWSSSGFTLASGNGLSEGLFNVPSNGSGGSADVLCTVTLGGVSVPIYKTVYVY